METRRSARIVALNPSGEVLLLRCSDPTPVDPSRPELLNYWVPAGGGVDTGESLERAAIREGEEETDVELLEMGPLVWCGERVLIRHGTRTRCVERCFVAWGASHGPLRNRTKEETFLPDGFAELVASLMRGEIPSVPIEIA
jgi:ADP-ribose pyrophosphatase YjhB (NUDIX family)